MHPADVRAGEANRPARRAGHGARSPAGGVRRAALLAGGALLLGLHLPTPARAQGFVGWIGLYHPDQLGWLENENRLRELCAEPAVSAQCRAEKLRPDVRAFPLHARPDSRSARAGVLIVVAVPGRGLSAHFHAAGANEAVTLVPDLFLEDWGYGPHFHQTIAARRGGWFQLPPGPWPEAVWIEPPDAEDPPLLAVRPGDIVTWNEEGWYVVGAEPDALRMRPEQPADMWCDAEAGDPPELVPTAPTRVTRPELLDAQGHLTISFRYPKGC